MKRLIDSPDKSPASLPLKGTIPAPLVSGTLGVSPIAPASPPITPLRVHSCPLVASPRLDESSCLVITTSSSVNIYNLRDSFQKNKIPYKLGQVPHYISQYTSLGLFVPAGLKSKIQAMLKRRKFNTRLYSKTDINTGPKFTLIANYNNAWQ